MNVYYDEKIIQPLGLSGITYGEDTGVLPKEGTFDCTGFPEGLSISVANKTDVGYGYVLSLNKGAGSYGETQLFIPHNVSISSAIPYGLKIRSCSDYSENTVGWTPWRSIAYYDEIESVCRQILKSEGLIK